MPSRKDAISRKAQGTKGAKYNKHGQIKGRERGKAGMGWDDGALGLGPKSLDGLGQLGSSSSLGVKWQVGQGETTCLSHLEACSSEGPF